MAAAKDRRLYARIDIGFDEHDKIYPLSDAAFRALIEMTLYSRRQLTDGFLAERLALKRWGADILEELSANDPERPSLVRTDDGWQIHDFAEHQTTNADIEAKREAGTKGAAKRWGGKADSGGVAPAIAPAIGDPMRNDGGTLAKTETETETTTPNGVVSSARDAFTEFWSIYPRRDDKRRAEMAFAKAVKRADVEVILGGAQRYADDPNRDPAFTKQPATWLNADSWENGPLPARSRGPVSAVQAARSVADELREWEAQHVAIGSR